MWHAGEFGGDGVAGDVFADSETERAGGLLPLFTVEDAVEADVGGFDVRDFDADDFLAGDWGFDAEGFGFEVEHDVGFELGDFGEFDATRRTEGKLRDARADVCAFHFDVDAEFAEGVFDDLGVVLDVASVGGGLFFLEEVEAGHLPIGVVDGDEGGFWFDFFGLCVWGFLALLVFAVEGWDAGVEFELAV